MSFRNFIPAVYNEHACQDAFDISKKNWHPILSFNVFYFLSRFLSLLCVFHTSTSQFSARVLAVYLTLILLSVDNKMAEIFVYPLFLSHSLCCLVILCVHEFHVYEKYGVAYQQIHALTLTSNLRRVTECTQYVGEVNFRSGCLICPNRLALFHSVYSSNFLL